MRRICLSAALIWISASGIAMGQVTELYLGRSTDCWSDDPPYGGIFYESHGLGSWDSEIDLYGDGLARSAQNSVIEMVGSSIETSGHFEISATMEDEVGRAEVSCSSRELIRFRASEDMDYAVTCTFSEHGNLGCGSTAEDIHSVNIPGTYAFSGRVSSGDEFLFIVFTDFTARFDGVGHVAAYADFQMTVQPAQTATQDMTWSAVKSLFQ
jgi:hypothetical protein